MQKSPDRGFSIGQCGGGVFGNADPGECISGRAGGSVETRAQPVDDDDRHQFCNFAPLLPAMKTPQVVGAHDPDESDARAAFHQPGYRIVGVSRLNDSFETRNVDAGMTREGARRGDSGRQRCQAARVLEGISGRNEPPDAVELEAFQGKKRCAEMSLVRRVESSTKQADPHAGRMRRQ